MREQFAAEVNHKEQELEQIEDRIHLAKMLLQRLRLGVLAQHYGVAAFYPTALDYREETIGEQHNWEMFEEYMSNQDPSADSAPPEEGGNKEEEVVLGGVPPVSVSEDDMCSKPKKPSTEVLGCAPVSEDMCGKHEKSSAECAPLSVSEEDDVCSKPQKPWSDMQNHELLEGEASSEPVAMDVSPAPPPLPPIPTLPRCDPSLACEDDGVRESRFYFKKRVIVGNTSQFLDPAAHSADGSSHKWMVYVRGSQAEPGISHFVKAVRFFLHPSYHPNDIVHVRTPPFHLTRLGWGEFPVRVQLEFCDKFNKSVDIIHNLVLDRTHTGQQTLGAETVVDLDIVAPPPGSEKTFRRNGVSISSMTVKQGEEVTPSSVQSSPPPLSPALTMPRGEDPTPPATPSGHQTTPPSLGIGVLTTNLDKCLHNAVRNIPIYGKCNPAEDFYIPAPSLAQFRLWHIGRRRATEWERAVAIRKSIARKLKLPSLLSTKQVMQWCRQNGYTPLDPVPASGRGFCKVCGCQLEAGMEEEEEDWAEEMEEEGSEGMSATRKCPEVHEHCQVMMFGRHGLPLRGNTMDPFEELQPNAPSIEEEGVASLPRLCSLSQPHELFAKVLSQQGRLEERAKQQDEDVDVCLMPSSPSCARSRALVDMVPRFRVPQTPELKWVQQTAAAVGIHVYPAVIDRMYAHVVEHMMYISCTRFLRGILAQAVQGAGQILDGKLSQDRVLTPFHVQQALLKLEHCD